MKSKGVRMKRSAQELLDARCNRADKIEHLGFKVLAARIRGRALRKAMIMLDSHGGIIQLRGGVHDFRRGPLILPNGVTLIGSQPLHEVQENPDQGIG